MAYDQHGEGFQLKIIDGVTSVAAMHVSSLLHTITRLQHNEVALKMV